MGNRERGTAQVKSALMRSWRLPVWLAAVALFAAALALAAVRARQARALREVAGFYWVYDDGSGPYTSAVQHAADISMLCPTWLTLKDSQGTVEVAKDTRLEAFAKEKGIRLVPLIACFSRKLQHDLLNSPESRTRLVNRIDEILDGYQYCQGVNLDLENLDHADRTVYGQFLAELAAKLKPKGYLITIDVPAKTRDDTSSDWSGAFDYAEINKYCDLIMLMTYDEHESHSGPGPISSVGFVEKCLKYATGIIPKEKLLLGIPFYGYDWGPNGKCKCLWYNATAQFIKDNKIPLMWDATAKAPWFTYTDKNGDQRTAWFENKGSIAAKLKVGKRYDVGGICIWSLGDEDPGIWDAIHDFRKR